MPTYARIRNGSSDVSIGVCPMTAIIDWRIAHTCHQRTRRMNRRRKDPLRALTEEEHTILTQIARAQSEPWAGAKALLAVAEGQSYTATAQAAGQVQRCRDSADSAFQHEGFAALEPRPDAVSVDRQARDSPGANAPATLCFGWFRRLYPPTPPWTRCRYAKNGESHADPCRLGVAQYLSHPHGRIMYSERA